MGLFKNDADTEMFEEDIEVVEDSEGNALGVAVEVEEFDDSDFEEEKPRTFEVNGRSFEVVLTKARLNLYEQRHTPIMASFIRNDGALSNAELTALLAYGLKLEGGAYVNPRKGTEMAEKLIETNGYGAVFECVFEALQRDCGFLFQ